MWGSKYHALPKHSKTKKKSKGKRSNIFPRKQLILIPESRQRFYKVSLEHATVPDRKGC